MRWVPGCACALYGGTSANPACCTLPGTALTKRSAPAMPGCSKWLLAPDGGNLMGETPLGSGGAAAGPAAATSAGPGTSSAAPAGVVDYSNAYRQDGSPNPAHRLWCCVLSLLAVLLAALPGHAAGRRTVAGPPGGRLAHPPACPSPFPTCCTFAEPCLKATLTPDGAFALLSMTPVPLTSPCPVCCRCSGRGSVAAGD